MSSIFIRKVSSTVALIVCVAGKIRRHLNDSCWHNGVLRLVSHDQGRPRERLRDPADSFLLDSDSLSPPEIISLAKLTAAYKDKVFKEASDALPDDSETCIQIEQEIEDLPQNCLVLTFKNQQRTHWMFDNYCTLKCRPRDRREDRLNLYECLGLTIQLVDGEFMDGKEFIGLGFSRYSGFDALVFRLATRTAFLDVEGERAFQR